MKDIPEEQWRAERVPGVEAREAIEYCLRAIFSDKKNIYECVNQNFCFFLIFDVKSHVFSYITGRTLQDLVFILMKKNKSEAYSEHCQISTIERFAKFEKMPHRRYLAGFRMRIRK